MASTPARCQRDRNPRQDCWGNRLTSVWPFLGPSPITAGKASSNTAMCPKIRLFSRSSQALSLLLLVEGVSELTPQSRPVGCHASDVHRRRCSLPHSGCSWGRQLYVWPTQAVSLCLKRGFPLHQPPDPPHYRSQKEVNSSPFPDLPSLHSRTRGRSGPPCPQPVS